MCYSDKCCYCVPLDFGCIVIGIFTFLFAMIIGMISTVLLALEQAHPGEAVNNIERLMSMELPSRTLKFILCILMLTQGLWMLFSAMLVRGIKRNNLSLVLSFFSYGILITILLMLSALLMLLSQKWLIAFAVFCFALFYIHCLVVVHSTYELMQRGKIFGLNEHRQLDESNLLD